MKKLFKKIILTLILLLTFNTIPTFALNTSTEEILFDEVINLSEDEYKLLTKMSKNPTIKFRNFSTNYSTYIQYSVSKSQAVNIKNTYNKLTNTLTYGGLGIWGGEKVANISKLKKYSRARTFIKRSGNWASNIINVLTFASVISINRFTSQIQSAVDKMNNRDKLLFRVESHDLMDSVSCRYTIRIVRR